MKVVETGLPGCVVIEPQVFGDARGYVYESFNRDKLAAHGLAPEVVQANVSASTRGVVSAARRGPTCWKNSSRAPGRRRSAVGEVSAAESSFADPLPQALVLTSIVISFGVTMFLLALAYRSWILTDDDEVQDDVGDRDVGRADVVHDEAADQAQVIAREEAP